MEAQFTKFDLQDNWVNGLVGKNYEFEAKLFDTGSMFGINNGRVSKLSIRELCRSNTTNSWFDGVIVNYDRGWDIEPNEGIMDEYNAVMKLLESAPLLFSK